MTWSLPKATRVPKVTFSIKSPCWLTAAMRRLVPPRSTPMEKLGIGQTVDYQIPLADFRWSRQLHDLLLTLWTIVTAATRNHNPLDRSRTDQARFASPAINPVLQLKKPLFTVCVNIIRDGKSAH